MPKDRRVQPSEADERQELLNFPSKAQIAQRRTRDGKLYVPLSLSEKDAENNIATTDWLLEEPWELQELPAGDEG